MPSSATLTKPVALQSPDDKLLQALRDVSLLRDLPDRIFDRLVAISAVNETDEDEILFRQGEKADRLHIVLQGQVAAFNTAPNGDIAVVEVVAAGHPLGLATVLARLPRLVGARTVTPCQFLEIQAAGLLGLLEQEPVLVTALLRAEAQQLRRLVGQVCDLKLRTTAQRLGCYLLSLAPQSRNNTTAMRLPFDKRLLAARLGCRQENLSRAFAALRSFGVETHGARVILHDIASLRAYSEPDEAFA